ncbi:MAG: formate/nitrite transporter family protein [Bacteroidales bacterium]|nr:formate/nitrite transporter family protein [Bacteroidales bacterium]
MPVRTPAETLTAAHQAGLTKAAANRPAFNFALSSTLAGAYIALGGVLSIIIGFGFPTITAENPGIQRLLSGAVFPIGLMLVVILGADLFTGNNALLMPPLASRSISPLRVATNWILVWCANFAGALIVAYFLVYLTDITAAQPYSDAVCRIGMAKVSASPWVVFLKGIGANWCVCLAVWLALSGRHLGEKLLACEIPVFAFVALGYEHCVANMFFIPLAMMQGAPIGISEMFTANLLPATLGNIVGGALFVGLPMTALYKRQS